MRDSLDQISIAMLGASGAVGGEVVKALLQRPQLARLHLLGRRHLEGLDDPRITQGLVDIAQPQSYDGQLAGADAAICTLGVGQPSQMSKAAFLAIDRDAVLAFGAACKAAGVKHFVLLGSVGATPDSASFYLRSKGELEEGLKALDFQRLSLCRPSMILTPHNRYGILQGITLALWPLLSVILLGPLQKFRGIKVAALGGAIAQTVFAKGAGVEVLEWPDLNRLAQTR